MTKVQADYYPSSIDQRVPLMTYAGDVQDGTHIVDLGTPDALDADGIWDGIAGEATAATFTSADFKTATFSGTLSGTYGRCLQVVASAGADHVLTISGKDYLGNPMQEQITVVNTVIQFGKKAFKFVDTVLVAAGAAGDTIDIGWYDRLGLPYKAEKVLSYTEDDVSFPVDPVDVLVEVDAVRFAAGTDVVVPSPVAGQITGVNSVVTTATTGASTATVVVISTDVVGLSIVIATGASVGDLDSDVATTDDDQLTSTVAKFGAIGISPDSTPSAGAANYLITVEPILFIAADETTVSATTTDVRGTIRVTTACDGSIRYECRYTVDTGNLHAIANFNG